MDGLVFSDDMSGDCKNSYDFDDYLKSWGYSREDVYKLPDESMLSDIEERVEMIRIVSELKKLLKRNGYEKPLLLKQFDKNKFPYFDSTINQLQKYGAITSSGWYYETSNADGGNARLEPAEYADSIVDIISPFCKILKVTDVDVRELKSFCTDNDINFGDPQSSGAFPATFTYDIENRTPRVTVGKQVFKFRELVEGSIPERIIRYVVQHGYEAKIDDLKSSDALLKGLSTITNALKDSIFMKGALGPFATIEKRNIILSQSRQLTPQQYSNIQATSKIR